jgi:hypothetical protein
VHYTQEQQRSAQTAALSRSASSRSVVRPWVASGVWFSRDGYQADSEAEQRAAMWEQRYAVLRDRAAALSRELDRVKVCFVYTGDHAVSFRVESQDEYMTTG